MAPAQAPVALDRTEATRLPVGEGLGVTVGAVCLQTAFPISSHL